MPTPQKLAIAVSDSQLDIETETDPDWERLIGSPRFEAAPLDAFVFENSVEGAFPRPPPGYYSRLSAKVVEQLRLAAAPAPPPSAMALPPAASAPNQAKTSPTHSGSL